MNPHVVPGAGRALIGSAAFLWVAIVPLVASGHHAVSAFLAGELAEIEGELVSVDWRNPHISFTVRTTNEEGEDDIWTLEAGAIYSIERRGVTAGFVPTRRSDQSSWSPSFDAEWKVMAAQYAAR